MNNNNKVTNPKTEVQKGPNLNEKDYMTDLLSTEKAMLKDYAVALTEASNEQFQQVYKEMFNEISMLQRKIYEVMFKNGWYCLEKVESIKIQEKLSKLNQELTDMNSN